MCAAPWLAALLATATELESPPPPPASGVTDALSMNPELALVLSTSAAYFTSKEPLQLGGHDPSRTGFNLQVLELHVTSNVDPFLRFEASLAFGLEGVELEEAYGSTLALPGGLQARAGQFLTRLGRINSMHLHAWNFADQPLVLGKFLGAEGDRGLGAELSWLSPLPWYAELVGSVTGASSECCARSFLGADERVIRDLSDLLYTTTLEQFFALTDDWSLLWGLSNQLGPNSSGESQRTELYATDLYLRYRPLDTAGRSALSLQAELLWRRRQVPGRLLADVGGYSQLVWMVDAQWELGARYEYVQGVADDPLDPDWTSERHRYSAQATYSPSHFSSLRLQASYDDPTWLQQGSWAVVLGLQLAVGAHGAHEY